MTLNIDAITVGLVALIAGIGQECSKEIFIYIRKYRDRAQSFLKNGEKKKERPLIKCSIMLIIAIMISLVFLWLANNKGSYWINASWAAAVWLGMEIVLFFEMIKERKTTK
jgi:TRAP-type uncharacterized transport system fused permease subunit